MREIKVGVFIFLALASLLFLTFQVKSLEDFNKKGYPIYAYINDVSGIQKQAKIKYRGVVVGVVDGMKLENDKVRLKLLIKDNYKIPEGVKVVLAQDNMLGGKYLKLVPPAHFSGHYLSKNGVIKKYEPAVSLDDVLKNVNGAVTDIRTFMAKVNNTFDNNATQNIKDSLANIEVSTEKLKSILTNADKKIPPLLDNANKLVVKYSSIGDDIKKRLPSILKKSDSLVGRFDKTGKILNRELPQLSNKYKKVADNVNLLLEDNRKNLGGAIKNAKDFFAAGNDSFKKIDNFLATLTQSQVKMAIESNYMARDDYFKTTATLYYIPRPYKYYIFALTSQEDFSDPTKIGKNHIENKTYFTAELGKRYDNLLLRGGIIDSTGGVGVDYFLNNDKVKLSSEIYDFNAVNDVRGNNPHLTFKAYYTMLKHLNFIGGIDNILNTDARTFFLGVGIKFKDNDIKTLMGGGATSFLK